MGKLNGILVAEALSDLDYFKYTSQEDIEPVKKEIIEGFDDGRILCTANLDERPYTPLCYRLYGCDGEDLFEMGGIVELLQKIKPTFDKLNIALEWSDDFISDDLLEHTIKINNKEYFAFKGNPSEMNAWAWATRNLVEIINDQLSSHNSNERIYPMSSGNQGSIVFLTKEQYSYIRTHFDKREGPMELELWWKSIQ